MPGGAGSECCRDDCSTTVRRWPSRGRNSIGAAGSRRYLVRTPATSSSGTSDPSTHLPAPPRHTSQRSSFISDRPEAGKANHNLQDTLKKRAPGKPGAQNGGEAVTVPVDLEGDERPTTAATETATTYFIGSTCRWGHPSPEVISTRGARGGVPRCRGEGCPCTCRPGNVCVLIIGSSPRTGTTGRRWPKRRPARCRRGRRSLRPANRRPGCSDLPGPG